MSATVIACPDNVPDVFFTKDEVTISFDVPVKELGIRSQEIMNADMHVIFEFPFELMRAMIVKKMEKKSRYANPTSP